MRLMHLHHSRMAVSLTLLVASGCGGRTGLRDEFDGGPIGTIDVPTTTTVDVPTTTTVDVPTTTTVDVPTTLMVDAPTTTVDVVSPPSPCELATTATPNVALPNQDTSTAFGHVGNCSLGGSTPAGAPLWYRVTVPGRSTLNAEAMTNNLGQPSAVRIYGSCAPASCLAHDLAPGPRLASAQWTNAGDAPVTVLAVVANYAADVPSRFTFLASTEPLVSNDTCATAAPVIDGTRLTGENLAMGLMPAAWCSPVRAGNALFYTVNMTVGEVLTVRATNATGGPAAPALRLGGGCSSGGGCYARSTTVGSGEAVLTFTNTFDNPVTLTLSVDPDGNAPFTFDLAVDIARAP